MVPGTYDDAVRAAAAEAERQGWFVVSDTSWPGYTEVPRDVMQGYRLMADEALDQWQGAPPTHVFIQAGVGGVAAAVSVQMRARLDPAPALVVVEPDRAACLLASAEAGRADGGRRRARHDHGRAWPAASRACSPGRSWSAPPTAFMAIPDAAAIAAMRLLAAQGVVSGESGAAGLAGLLLAAADPAARAALRARTRTAACCCSAPRARPIPTSTPAGGMSGGAGAPSARSALAAAGRRCACCSGRAGRSPGSRCCKAPAPAWFALGPGRVLGRGGARWRWPRWADCGVPGRRDMPALLAIGLLQLAGFFAFAHAAVAWVPAGRDRGARQLHDHLHRAALAAAPARADLGRAAGLRPRLGRGRDRRALTGPWAIDWAAPHLLLGHVY